MSKLPAHPKQDEKWCEIMASLSADELVAGGVIRPDQKDFAMKVIRQQAYVLLVSNCYPAGDLNSN
jgi:hypothetical protein